MVHNCSFTDCNFDGGSVLKAPQDNKHLTVDPPNTPQFCSPAAVRGNANAASSRTNTYSPTCTLLNRTSDNNKHTPVNFTLSNMSFTQYNNKPHYLSNNLTPFHHNQSNCHTPGPTINFTPSNHRNNNPNNSSLNRSFHNISYNQSYYLPSPSAGLTPLGAPVAGVPANQYNNSYRASPIIGTVKTPVNARLRSIFSCSEKQTPRQPGTLFALV